MPTATPPDQTMTQNEIVSWLEEQAQSRGFASAATLIESYRQGALEEPCEVLDILGLAFLLPEDHPLHAPLAGLHT